MIYLWLLIIVIALVILFAYLYMRTPSNYPPGPMGVPILGSIPWTGKYIERIFKKWSLEKYGPVMSVRLGLMNIIVLNTYESIKEAFVVHTPKCDRRPQINLFRQAQGQFGLLLLDYPNNYPVQKCFGMQALTKLGMGKEAMEKVIIEELEFLVPHLIRKAKEPADLRWDFYAATSNILARISFGRRYDYDDPIYIEFLQILKSKLCDPKEAKLLFLLINLPFLNNIPPFSGAKRRFIERFSNLHEFVRQRYNEHKQTFDKDNLRDFIDHFIYQEEFMNHSKQERFFEKQLVAYVRDLFGGGAESTGVELYWVFFCLLKNPDYYKKILEEIDIVYGDDPPRYEDRYQLPITMAFLEEVWRVSTPITKSILHKTDADLILQGYTIPKHTQVESNQWGSNHDPVTFPNPTKFDPGRHLDENGKFIKDSKVITLGIGMHRCLGADLALMEIFLFTIGILQKLKLSSASSPLPDYNDTNKGLTNNPKDYKVTLKKRKESASKSF